MLTIVQYIVKCKLRRTYYVICIEVVLSPTWGAIGQWDLLLKVLDSSDYVVVNIVCNVIAGDEPLVVGFKQDVVEGV